MKNPMPDVKFEEKFAAFRGYSHQEFLLAQESKSYAELDKLFVANVWKNDSLELNDLLDDSRKTKLDHTTNFFDWEWIMDVHTLSGTTILVRTMI